MAEIRMREFLESDLDSAADVMHTSMLTAAEVIGGFKRAHMETRTVDMTRSRVLPAFSEGKGLVAEVLDTAILQGARTLDRRGPQRRAEAALRPS